MVREIFQLNGAHHLCVHFWSDCFSFGAESWLSCLEGTAEGTNAGDSSVIIFYDVDDAPRVGSCYPLGL